jgi:hypothetical protein
MHSALFYFPPTHPADELEFDSPRKYNSVIPAS